MRHVLTNSFLSFLLALSATFAGAEERPQPSTADLVAYQAAVGRLNEIVRAIELRKDHILRTAFASDPELQRLEEAKVGQEKEVERLKPQALREAEVSRPYEPSREVEAPQPSPATREKTGSWRRAGADEFGQRPNEVVPDDVRLHRLRVENERLREEIKKTQESARKRSDKYERKVYNREQKAAKYAKSVREAYAKAAVINCPADVVYISPSVVEKSWGFAMLKISTTNPTNQPMAIRDNITNEIVVRNLCPNASLVITKVYPWKTFEAGTVPVSYSAFSENPTYGGSSHFESSLYQNTWQRIRSEHWTITLQQ